MRKHKILNRNTIPSKVVLLWCPIGLLPIYTNIIFILINTISHAEYHTAVVRTKTIEGKTRIWAVLPSISSTSPLLIIRSSGFMGLIIEEDRKLILNGFIF